MFGFACDDNAEYKPTAMVIMQEFSKFYDELRQKRFTLADGKTQLVGEYDDNMRLVKIKDRPSAIKIPKLIAPKLTKFSSIRLVKSLANTA